MIMQFPYPMYKISVKEIFVEIGNQNLEQHMNGMIQTFVFRDEIQCLIRDFMIRQYPLCVS